MSHDWDMLIYNETWIPYLEKSSEWDKLFYNQMKFPDYQILCFGHDNL